MAVHCDSSRDRGIYTEERKDDVPRKDILRAVETSAGSMGLAEKSFLWAFSWLDTRFRIQDYWSMSRNAYYNMHVKCPLPMPRNTNSESSGTGIPCTAWGNFLLGLHHPSSNWISARPILRPGGEGTPRRHMVRCNS